MNPACYPYITTGSPNPWACPPAYPDGTGMAAALQLLLGGQLAPLINFSGFAFLAGGFAAGASLTSPAPGQTAADNLSSALTGTFSGFAPSGTGLAEISAPLYAPCASARGASVQTAAAAAPSSGSAGAEAEPASVSGGSSGPQAVGFQAAEARLDALDAVAFTPAGSGSAAAANYQAAKQLLIQLLNGAARPQPEPRCPGQTPVPGAQPVPAAAPRSVSLAAGHLLLANAAPLGAFGNIRFLANDAGCRFYLVRADRVEFQA